ncbi:MAG TPA: PAS domain S-box protein [Polyangiales bacterium]
MTPARIVIVEDDRVVARDIAEQLERIGHTVVGTTSRGEEALALTLATKPNLVLMDIRLEGELDGIDAAEQIRARSHLPVIFLTAYADDPTVRRASKAEPFGYLLKPFEDLQLRTAIEMALYNHAAEQRLRESERRFAVTLASIGDAVIATDAKGEITFMNPVAEALTGFSKREAAGLPLAQVFRIVNEDTRLTVEDPAAKVLRLGKTVGLANHTVLLARDGREIAIDDSGAPIIDDDGVITGVVLVFRDITQRRQAEQAELLRKSNARIELALQGSDIAMWEFELPDGTLETAKVRGTNGWSSYGYVGDVDFASIAQNWHPEDRDRVIAAIRAYLAGETDHYELECRMRRADGAYRTRMVRGVATRDATGKATRFIGTSVDITERIKLEEALRASEERYRNTFEHAPAGLVHTDFENASVLRVNQTYVDMTGWSREELLGPGGMAIIHPDDRASGLERFAALANGTLTSYSTPLRLFRKDGSLMWIRLTVSKSQDAAGGRPYAIAMVEDISERQLLQLELQSAKEAAEASNRAKDEFLANVSHEIRTPMNAILGMTELVLDTPLDPAQRQSLVTVKSAAASLLAIINDLLDFSKIEAGKMLLDPSEFQLRPLLGDTLRALAVRAQRKGLALSSEVASEVPTVLVGDAGRVRQVLVNLVGNAIKFTEEGDVRVEVSCDAQTPVDVQLHVSVRDTGIGIPEDRQASIFRAFEQEDMSTTRRYGGTGLGLTIAARLVEMMGGTLKVESMVGRGSTFSFAVRFPYGEAALPSSPEPAPAAPVADEQPSWAGLAPTPMVPLRVLVAEDNPFNSLLLQNLLSSRGHAVRMANDGAEALGYAKSGGFDLLLLDLHMPERDGFEVIEALRAHERVAGGHLLTIALTARSRAEDRARCFAAGMDAFLAKPIQAAALWSTIERISRPTMLARAPEGPAPAQQSLVSAEVLLAACGGNPVVLAAIRNGLRARFPEALQALGRAFDERDALRLREAAHSMFGMVAAFSNLAGSIASTLEDVAANGELEAAGELIERLRTLAPALFSALENVTIASLTDDVQSKR